MAVMSNSAIWACHVLTHHREHDSIYSAELFVNTRKTHKHMRPLPLCDIFDTSSKFIKYIIDITHSWLLVFLLLFFF